MKHKKKLIEVALPLEAINKASAKEKSIRHGHPSTLHLWWARRPLAAARAVIFAQMVDDPSAHPDNPVSVREALALINEVLDEALAEQEGDFDSDSRWALAWFEQMGFAEGDYGVAETLSKAKNTSVKGMEDAEILVSSRGKVRLLKPDELPPDWDPLTDKRLTAWEMVHHLIRALNADGEPGAAAITAKLGSKAETARELCYRLYTLCDRKKRAAEALSYNALVQSWPEISRMAGEIGKLLGSQPSLFETAEA